MPPSNRLEGFRLFRMEKTRSLWIPTVHVPLQIWL